MTEHAPDETVNTIEEPVDGGAPEAGEAEDPKRQANHEAAKYRRQLRDTEAERDALARQVDGLHQQIVETALAARLAKPEGFWLSGAKPSEFFDQEGKLDLDALHARADEIAAQFGLQKPLAGYVPTQGTGDPTAFDRADWAGFLRADKR